MSQQRKRNMWYKRLIETGCLPADVRRELRGRAAAYASRYQRALENAVKYAREDGLLVVEIPGKRGGRWSGEYIVISKIL